MDAIAKREAEQQRLMILCAGLPTSAVYNVHRKKGSKPVKPQDFIKAPPKIVSPEEMEAALDAWAASVSARIK